LNEETLDKWLTDPQVVAPSAKMFFHLDNPQDRAEDMTAPTTKRNAEIALDQRAPSRHDNVVRAAWREGRRQTAIVTLAGVGNHRAAER
jgi:hypothetical protein